MPIVSYNEPNSFGNITRRKFDYDTALKIKSSSSKNIRLHFKNDSIPLSNQMALQEKEQVKDDQKYLVQKLDQIGRNLRVLSSPKQELPPD